MPLVLQLLLTGYGFGPPTEAQPDSLTAPQATLMQSVADGVFSGNLPWPMVYAGMAIGAVVIALDSWQEARGSSFRIPVLAVAVGIYLPFELDSAIMLGGLIALGVSWYQTRNKENVENFEAQEAKSENSGLLFASGLITGEALIGIGLAIPVAIWGSGDVMAIADDPFGSLPGILVVAGICWWLYSIATKSFLDQAEE